MEKTHFYFPTEAEASVFRTLCPDAYVRVIGVGMAEATSMAFAYISALNPKRVVLCGIAGACDDSLQVGQVVAVVNDAVAGLPEAYARGYGAKSVEGLTAVNSLTVNHTGDSLPYLTENQDIPCIEQMEGAGVAAACESLGIDEFYHIRAISNRVGDDRSEWHIDDAVTSLGAVVAQLFKE